MPIENLVLVVGAGASRNLGSDRTPLPLMADWAAIVRDALNQRSFGLTEVLGIAGPVSGPEFERAIGEFLAWQRVIPLAARFLPVGYQDRQPQPDGEEDRWQQHATFQANLVVDALHSTLYDQFNAARIADVAATKAYGSLLHALEFAPHHTLTVATTNYDPAIEIALAELDRRPEVGDVAGPGRSRILDPEGLVQRCGHRGTAVLHLHGKVGWYTRPDEKVLVTDDHAAFNGSYGRPTLLMPDPDKDPLVQPGVRDLWAEFDVALKQATHVLVLGHSLHDPVLLDHIRHHASRAIKGVCVRPGADGPDVRRRAMETFRGNTVTTEVEFGPAPDLDAAALLAWSNFA